MKANIYYRTAEQVGAGKEGWYFSCCGIEQGPFDQEGTAKAAAALHEYVH